MKALPWAEIGGTLAAQHSGATTVKEDRHFTIDENSALTNFLITRSR